MKKETISSELIIDNNQYMIYFKNHNECIPMDSFLNNLKKGVHSQGIRACNAKIDKGYINFKFKIYDNEGKFSNYFVIKVKESKKNLFRPVINEIKQISEISILIKKVNVNRFIAGVAVSAMILTVAGPTLVRGLGNLLEKEYEYDQQRYNNYYYQQEDYQPTEDEIRQSEIEYYEDLKQRAQEGDEEAKKEYQAYSLEQQIKELIKEEEQGYHR